MDISTASSATQRLARGRERKCSECANVLSPRRPLLLLAAFPGARLLLWLGGKWRAADYKQSRGHAAGRNAAFFSGQPPVSGTARDRPGLGRTNPADEHNSLSSSIITDSSLFRPSAHLYRGAREIYPSHAGNLWPAALADRNLQQETDRRVSDRQLGRQQSSPPPSSRTMLPQHTIPLTPRSITTATFRASRA